MTHYVEWQTMVNDSNSEWQADIGEWYKVVNDGQWIMTNKVESEVVGEDRQWWKSHNWEWQTMVNDKQWHTMMNDRQCEWHKSVNHRKWWMIDHG